MKTFKTLYPDYPAKVFSEEQPIVSTSDVPSGGSGINQEGYTYGELCRQPMIPEVLKLINNPLLLKMADECNERSRKQSFLMFIINGDYCFWGLRVGPVIPCPTLEEYMNILGTDNITAEMIRAVNYDIYRRKLAEMIGTTPAKAGRMIGAEAVCVIHEDKAGYMYMVPQWAHEWFTHAGYVSYIISELSK